MGVSDDLAALQKDNAERLQALGQTGTQVGGLKELYTLTMLEHLCGEDLPFVQLGVERKVSVMLNDIEAAARTARLLAPGRSAVTPPPKR